MKGMSIFIIPAGPAEMLLLGGRRRPLAPFDNVSINDVCDSCVKPG